MIRTLPPILITCALLLGPAPAEAKKLRHSPCNDKSKLPGCLQKRHKPQTQPYERKTYQDNGLSDTITPLGRKARGIYLTPYWLPKVGAEATARMLKRAHLNAVVIDVKDDWGRILWPSQVPLSRGLQKHLIRDPKKLIKVLHEQGIYAIARIVCFKDSRLPYKRPDLAVRIGSKARRLFSAGANWVDQYSPEVQDYIIDLALELQSYGFDEVQLDYIRFPKGRAGAHATWLHQDDRPRYKVITDFLERIDRALTIPLSVDVYGLTTLVDGDPRGLGQTIEVMAKYAEAISPMMYANGMDTYFKNNKVTPKVYHIIHCGLWRARQKAPNVVLRPYLQSYPNNVEHFFGPNFIKQQVLVAEKSGCNGFLFWNSTMKNAVAYKALRRLGKGYVTSFGDNTDQYKEPENAPGDWCPATGQVWGDSSKKKDKKRDK